MAKTDDQVEAEIRGYVSEYGLHASWQMFGKRCCTFDELDDAIAHEIKQRRERNSTSMIVTTGGGANPPGVFLPPAPAH